MIVGHGIGTCMLQCHVANIFNHVISFLFFGLQSCFYLLFLNTEILVAQDS